MRDERADRADSLKFTDVKDRAIENLKVEVQKVNWFSTYHVHHRVTEHFRKGRAFLLGDAAHIHSPAGGQGMNTGIGDAINLAWKLAMVLQGRAPDNLLDSYEAERIAFARRLVATTDRVFSFVTADGPLAEVLRMRVAPLLIPTIASFEAAREYLFRTVSQITLNYRGGPLSAGEAGKVHGGDRLPWAPVDGHDNFSSLAAMDWQVHVYGSAGEDLVAACGAEGLPLHVFNWRPEHDAAGLARDALYLLRPDTYVALADRSGSPGRDKALCRRPDVENIGDGCGDVTARAQAQGDRHHLDSPGVSAKIEAVRFGLWRIWRAVMRFLAFIGALAILAAIAAAIFLFGGFYDAAAIDEQPAVVDWALANVREPRSRATRRKRRRLRSTIPRSFRRGRAPSRRGAA